MKQQINVGLLGLGTVGSGVVRIIQEHQEELQHQVGCSIQVKKILVKDLNKKRDITVDPDVLTIDPNDIIQNDDIDVVIEVIGGVEETKEYIVTALRNKKHVITANKDLMALYGSELLTLATENGCDLLALIRDIFVRSETIQLKMNYWKTYADPGHFQCLFRSDAFLRVHREHGVDQALRFGCHRVPLWTWVLKLFT